MKKLLMKELKADEVELKMSEQRERNPSLQLAMALAEGESRFWALLRPCRQIATFLLLSDPSEAF